jgi:hypothetical protein
VAPLFAGPGASHVDGLARSRVLSVRQLGDDLRIDLAGAMAPSFAANTVCTQRP